MTKSDKKNEKNQSTHTASNSDTTAESPHTNNSQYLLTLLNNLKSKSDDLKTKLCTATNKLYTNITGVDIKNSNKISKTTLGDDMLSLLGLADVICCSDNINYIKSHVDDVDVASLKSVDDLTIIGNDIKQSIQKELQELNKSNEFVFQSIQDQVNKLEKLVKQDPCRNYTSQGGEIMGNPTPKPVDNNTTKPLVKPYDDLLHDFIPTECADSLIAGLSSTYYEYEPIGDRSVLYFGEYDYSYSGKTHRAREFPASIAALVNKINTQFPKKTINSCLVTKYTDGHQFCPSHSDDEYEIHPDSNIYTLSIGVNRKMVFHSVSDPNNEHSHTQLPDGSLLIFSRLSQDTWKHSVPVDLEVTSIRYSLTFRFTAPYHINSTVICGDSNTRDLAFGTEGHKNFGKWMPGKRINCTFIEDIPAPQDIGPYKNIVMHVGINDIKSNNHMSIDRTAHTLELKCKAIHDVYPTANIYLSPLLPTKDPVKNDKVLYMNRCIQILSNKHPNLHLMVDYHQFFSDMSGRLRPEMGKFKGGRSNDSDELHLGTRGLNIFAQCIKHCVLRRKGPIVPSGSVRKFNINHSNTHGTVTSGGLYSSAGMGGGDRGRRKYYDVP